MRGSDADDFAPEPPLFRPPVREAFTATEIARYFAARIPKLRQTNAREWRGPCPIHQGKRDSFAVSAETGQWTCHSACARGGDIFSLEIELMRHADFPTAKAEVFRIIGRNDFLREGTPPGRSQRGRIVQTYDYTDEGGSLLFQTVRMDPKGFKQRRPDGHGRWLWNLNGVLPVLYRLPELLSRKNETLFIVEGEKDVHSLESMGLLATCNPMGAGKWRSEYSNAILGRSVVILSDNDPPVDENGNPHRRGQKHAGEVAKDLLRVGCEVRIIELPEAKDVSDWIALGGTRQDLQSLVSKQTALNEETLATWRSRWSPQAGEEDPRDESLNGRASREPNQAQLLITFAEQAKLFHTPEGEAFAELPVAVHFETWILRSRGFRRWLIKEVLSRNSMNTKQR